MIVQKYCGENVFVVYNPFKSNSLQNTMKFSTTFFIPIICDNRPLLTIVIHMIINVHFLIKRVIYLLISFRTINQFPNHSCIYIIISCRITKGHQFYALNHFARAILES